MTEGLKEAGSLGVILVQVQKIRHSTDLHCLLTIFLNNLSQQAFSSF
jgi:hypothetical protein